MIYSTVYIYFFGEGEMSCSASVSIFLSVLLPAACFAAASDSDSSYSQGSPPAVSVTYAGSSLADLLQASSSVHTPGSRWGEVGWDSQYARWLSEGDAGLLTDRMHVRGGRRGELAWELDGLELTDPLTRAPLGRVPLAFLERSDLNLAGIPAEHGRAMSGLVRASTPEGGDAYSGTVGISGNDWQALGLAEDREWMTWDSWNDAAACITASIGGPEPLTERALPAMGVELPGEVRLFAAGEHLRTGGGEDGRYGWGFDGWSSSWTGSARISWRPSERTRLDLTGYGSDMKAGWFGVRNTWRWHRYEEDYYVSTDSMIPGSSILYGLPTRFWTTTALGARLRQELAGEMGLELALSHYSGSFDYRIRNEPGGPYLSDWLGDGWSDQQWDDYDPELVADADGFFRDGTGQWARRETESDRTAAGFALTWPFGETHLFRAGSDIRMIGAESFGVRVDTMGTATDRWSAEPLEGSAYLADSVLLGDLTLDAGVRLDLFDPALDELENGSTYPVSDADRDTKYALSPRLSALHRLTERDAIHMAYGHYSQMPRPDMLYSAGSVPAYVEDPVYPLPSNGLPVQGNPGLGFQRTVQYEVGYTRSLDGLTEADATVYRREMSDLAGTTPVTASSDTIPDYFVYDNSGTANSTGLELTLAREPSRTGWLYGSASWSWSLAEGTSSGPLLGYRETLEGVQPAGEEHPLDWDQRHTLALDIGVRAPDHISSPVLAGLGAALRWTYGSGYPYTYNEAGAAEQESNGWRYPETMRTDLRLEKRFRAGPLRMTGWMGWRNLFDRRNLDFIASVPWYQVGVGSHFDADPTGPLDNGYVYSQPRRMALGLDIAW